MHVAVIGVLAAGVAAAAWLDYRAADRTALECATVQATQASQLIYFRLWEAMLSGKTETVQSAAESAAGQHPGVDVAIYSAAGRVWVDSHAERRGKPVSPDRLSQAERASNDASPTVVRKGARNWGFVTALRSRPECAACHRPANSVIGYMEVDMDTGPLLAEHARARRYLMLTAAAVFLGVILVVSGVLHRLVTAPVRGVLRAMREVRSGGLATQIGDYRHDDLGLLAASFNRMVRRLAHTRNELVAAQHELAEAQRLASLGVLAGGVAHEINNPLMSIMAGAEALRAPSLSQEQRDQVAALLQRQCERLSQVTRNLLSFDRLVEMSMAEVDLAQVITQTVSGLEAQIHTQGVRMELDFQPDLNVMADRDRLRTAFVNIILNSLQAMPSGGQLRIQATRQGDNVIAAITDTGTGIAAEDLPRIFDPFYTTKEVGEGAGLGLATVHAIVTRHGGKVTVTSEPGQGTTLVIALPAAPASSHTSH